MNQTFGSLAVVIDAGSQTMKVGFAGDTLPRSQFPTAVARLRHDGLADGFPAICCGHEAFRNRGFSRLTHPVQEGFIQDWDEMEKLWHHTFYKELMIPPEDIRLLHIVHPLISKKDKEKMAEILFEVLAVNGLYLGQSPVMALHSSGKTTGVTWECGESCCHSIAVFEGFPLKNTTSVSPLTGSAMTDILIKLLAVVGYNFTTASERDIIEVMKSKLLHVAEDFKQTLEKFEGSGQCKVTYKLPDGQNVFVGNERFMGPEVLFQPALQGFDCPSIVDMITSTINSCDLDYRSQFYGNIVLAGGASQVTGLSERLQIEMAMKVMLLPGVKANVEAMPMRHFAAWTGGSMIGSLESLKGFWVSAREYDDVGTDIVNQKFF